MEITKMHGLGNDFIMVEKPLSPGTDASALAQKLCRRGVDVGADGILLMEPSEAADIRMRIFNADGSEAEMCGNGIRCFAKYVYDSGAVKKEKMEIETLAGIISPELSIKDGAVKSVRVDMGRPVFEADRVPVMAGEPLDFEIAPPGGPLRVSAVLMGVPHTVVVVDDLDAVDIKTLGPAIENYEAFPQKTNVNFVQALSPALIRIRTWERGAGATMACGTGACAAAVVCHMKGLTKSAAAVRSAAGELEIEWTEEGRVFMTGPAAYVFRGRTLDD